MFGVFSKMLIRYACEDAPSRAVAIKLINQKKDNNCEIRELGGSGSGCGPIFTRLDSYSNISKDSGEPVIIFIDLDNIRCAPRLLGNLQKSHPIKDRQPPNKFQIRIAVREVESWLLADKQGMETYFGISQKAIPPSPEKLSDPKQELLNLIKKNAKARFKREMLPKGKGNIGTGYNDYLVHFIDTVWDYKRACTNSDSLTRAIKRIKELT